METKKSIIESKKMEWIKKTIDFLNKKEFYSFYVSKKFSFYLMINNRKIRISNHKRRKKSTKGIDENFIVKNNYLLFLKVKNIIRKYYEN